MVSALNCDDRRQALSIYRDAFEGRVGQIHGWHNENGGGAGTVVLVRRYSANGVNCSDVRATANSQELLHSRRSTACRQQDGNWHTQ
jgi:surface antigen